jgi:carbamoyl-phosphate synthase large subunit
MRAKRVLITGAGGSAAQNFIQSLQIAPEPYEIFAVDCNLYHLQWPDAVKRYLAPTCDHPEYIDILNEIIREEGIDFIHPQPDVEVRAISEARDRLQARTYLPSADTIRLLQDKELTGKMWAAAGLRRRPTLSIANREDVERAARTLGLPFWARATTGAGAKGSTLVENIETAVHWLAYWQARGVNWRFIAESYLPGRDYAWQSVWSNGELIASQGRERLEYIYPHLAPSGRTGTPIVAKTVNQRELNDVAIRSVLAIDPNATGIFSVDLREDAEGNPIPTEINCGRFFTTSFFYAKAGLNMAYFTMKLAFNEPFERPCATDGLEEGLHWIRHIDCPTILAREHELCCIDRTSKLLPAHAA